MTKSTTLDQLVFGAWWSPYLIDLEQVHGWSLSQLNYAIRTAIAYEEISISEGWHVDLDVLRVMVAAAVDRLCELKFDTAHRSHYADLLHRLRAGDKAQFVSLLTAVADGHGGTRPSNPYGPGWEDLDATEARSVVDDLIAEGRATRGNLDGLTHRISSRFRAQTQSVDLTFRVIAGEVERTLASDDPVVGSIEFEWRVLNAPRAMEHLVDMAMFMPTPPGTERIILISNDLARRARTDTVLASRLPLAVTHELFGHAAQFDRLQRSMADVRGLRLDRELLEGWAILAERGLSWIGEDEKCLHKLYRAKRLLPLVRRADPGRWDQTVQEIEQSWPLFFSDPATEVFRRSIGSHSRGLARAERIMKHVANSTGHARPVHALANPWVLNGPVGESGR